MPLRFWVLTAVCAMLPDADVAGFIFGIRYSDVFGHRGLSHSFFFAAVVGALAALWSRWADAEAATGPRTEWSGRSLALYFALVTVTASHPLLDALTNGGLGVALFAPSATSASSFPGGRLRSRRSAPGSSAHEGCAYC
jgi:inner membrane protein